MSSLSKSDPEVYQIIQEELKREEEQIELIASENLVGPGVLEAQGSVLTNKYAEGYPNARWYQGCESIDKVEALAIERVLSLFGAEYANVQPHSGSQANMAVYFSMLKPGDKVLAMDLACGGHLTHGHARNFSGKFFHIISYGVKREDEQIDYDQLAGLARKEKPKMIIAGASAYPREIDFVRFRKIADSVGAFLLVDMAHIGGLVAAGIHQDPVPYAEFVTCTTHKTLRGPRGGLILCRKEFGGRIDTEIFPGIQGGPLMHVIAAKAVAFGEALQPDFKVYQQQIVKNAKALTASLQELGYRIVSGGTDNHLILIDLNSVDISGKEAARLLEEAGIIVNKNLIPVDPKPPALTSGIRLGTPSVTTRGMEEAEMRMIAGLINKVLRAPTDKTITALVKEKVKGLTETFPTHKGEQ